MERKEDPTEDSDYEISPISQAVDALMAPFHALISKEAQRAYLGTLLFVGTSIFLFGVATVAYWIFYFNFVPQVGLERVVHLQFGDGNPWGTASLDSELASLQPYDVSVTLQLPRTPSNLAAGNFMLDLAFFSRPSSSIIPGTNTSTHLITRSRRPAILTYASPIVDTAHKISRMPLYLAGWQREAETLEVSMMESVEFARGWRNLPGSLKLEIQSKEEMQIYSAVVKFRANFTGLRWIMYNWRILSFFVFASMFWGVSIVSTSVAWLLLSSYIGSNNSESEKPIKEEDSGEDDDHAGSEEESVDPFSSGELSDNQRIFPTLSRQMPLRSSGRAKGEDEELIKQEETEGSTTIPPAEEADDEAEEVEGMRTAGNPTDSGIGTGLDSGSSGSVQRRRSRLFDSHGHDAQED
ncbi:hypothetical protein VTN77DRAFT_156 [Rasamsonia byssochlamydoides]|uniref:uncharacterized protein n=1 Tax=Rasamsonia byssochlamydoides TaxID=89139 RepID=UPI0037436828